MTLTSKLLRILEIVNSDGGTAFVYIREALEDVERNIEVGNPLAIRFGQELDHILKFCEATKTRD